MPKRKCSFQEKYSEEWSFITRGSNDPKLSVKCVNVILPLAMGGIRHNGSYRSIKNKSNMYPASTSKEWSVISGRNRLNKFQQMGDWDKMHHEQINATRLIKQLKALLYEMDMLRNQVQNSDLIKFDKITENARRSAQDAIEEYFDLKPQGQSLWVPPSDISYNVQKVQETTEEKQKLPELQTKLSACSSPTNDFSKREECLKSMENLQAEVRDVFQLFEEFSLIVKEQSEKINEVENSIETSAVNVKEGASNLARAVSYKVTMYPIAGAILGGCLGGPIGLIAGFKLGGIAAIGCGVLGNSLLYSCNPWTVVQVSLPIYRQLVHKSCSLHVPAKNATEFCVWAIGFTGGQLLQKKHKAVNEKSEVELVEVNQGLLSSSQISAVLSDQSRSTLEPTARKIQ